MRQPLNTERLRDMLGANDMSFVRLGVELYVRGYADAPRPHVIVERWLAGEVNPNDRTVLGFADIFGKPATWFREGHDGTR